MFLLTFCIWLCIPSVQPPVWWLITAPFISLCRTTMDLREGNQFESKVKTFSCNLGEKLRRIAVMFSVYCNWKTPEAFDDYTQNFSVFRRKTSSGRVWKPGRRLLMEVLWLTRHFLDTHALFVLCLWSTCTAQHCPIVAQSDPRSFFGTHLDLLLKATANHVGWSISSCPSLDIRVKRICFENSRGLFGRFIWSSFTSSFSLVVNSPSN